MYTDPCNHRKETIEEITKAWHYRGDNRSLAGLRDMSKIIPAVQHRAWMRKISGSNPRPFAMLLSFYTALPMLVKEIDKEFGEKGFMII